MRAILMRCVWVCFLISPQAVFAEESISATIGKHEIVFPAGYHSLNYFPDEPISILSKKPFRLLVVAVDSTVLMQGATLNSAVPVRKVLAPGNKGDHDGHYAGITSTYYDKKTRKLLGFYHAEDRAGIQGAYWSIGLAVSMDNGNTFQKAGQILGASVTKKQVTMDNQGIGDVYVISEPTNTYLYAYYSDLTRRKEDITARIGMARCRIADGAKPGTWYKYRHGEFKEKGLGGSESGVVNPPTTFPSEVFAPHVTYVSEWKKYLMVCNVGAYTDFEKRKAEKGGIFFCHSDDGITDSCAICATFFTIRG